MNVFDFLPHHFVGLDLLGMASFEPELMGLVGTGRVLIKRMLLEWRGTVATSNGSVCLWSEHGALNQLAKDFFRILV